MASSPTMAVPLTADASDDSILDDPRIELRLRPLLEDCRARRIPELGFLSLFSGTLDASPPEGAKEWRCGTLIPYCFALAECSDRILGLVDAIRRKGRFQVLQVDDTLGAALIDSRESIRATPPANIMMPSGTAAAPLIAVFDTGVDDRSRKPFHPFLPSATFSIDKVSTDKFPADLNGHGTAVAVAALGRDNDKPIGVCPTCGLVDVRVLRRYGVGKESEVVWALEDVIHRNLTNAQPQVRVALMAFAADTDSRGDDVLSCAINCAFENGILVVSAIGNRPTKLVPTPAAASCGLAVGGVDTRETGTGRALASGGRIVEVPGGRDDDKWWRFSSEGPRLSPFIPDPDACPNGHLKPDVVAPAVNVCVPLAEDPKYCQPRDGTSMAAALVAGAAGLLFATYPKASAADVANALRNTACFGGIQGTDCVAPAWDEKTGWGMIDVHRALQELKP